MILPIAKVIQVALTVEIREVLVEEMQGRGMVTAEKAAAVFRGVVSHGVLVDTVMDRGDTEVMMRDTMNHCFVVLN
jgi:hypothetical protein